MAIVVSFVNMKGGVGKTTLAAQMAHFADQRNLRVLAVDLDPQSNLSQSILGAAKYLDYLRRNKPTIIQVFEGYRPPSGKRGGPRRAGVKDVILKNAGYWTHSTLDLIPSKLELARSLKSPSGKERKLAEGLASVDSDYDLILLDCRPTESILTEAAYFASRYLVVPVKPQFLGAIGLPLLGRSLDEFRAQNADHELEVAGIGFNQSSGTKPGPKERRATAEIEAIAKANGWPVYPVRIRESRSYAKAAREGAPIAETTHVRWWIKAGFSNFAAHFFQSIGITLK